MTYPIENLLRRPVEMLSAGMAIGAALASIAAPTLFFLSPRLSIIAALGFAILALWRTRQGMALMRYQRNLRKLPLYLLAPAALPFSYKRLYLGRGFKWDQRHTMRLHQVREPRNRHFTEQSAVYNWVRQFELKYEHEAWAQPFIRFANQPTWLGLPNPVLPLPPVQGKPELHGVEPNEYEVTMDLAERVGHVLVIGSTRVGKTRLAEMWVTQDIRRGDVTIILDPKGDSELFLRAYSEAVRAGREHEFYFFHLGYPDLSARYNPIGSFSRITEVATRIAGRLPDEGQSSAFKEFVWRFVNVLSRALAALGRKPDYATIYQTAVHVDELAREYFEYWLNRDHPGWEDSFEVSEAVMKDIQKQASKTGRDVKALEILAFAQARGWHDSVADGLASILSNDRSYFEKLVSSLYPLLEKLTTGKTSGLLSPDYEDAHDSRPIFDWMQIINKGGIVYCGFDALTDDEVAAAVSSAMFADLMSVAGQIYKYDQAFGQSATSKNRKIAIHADEVHKMLGDEFIPIINMAGGAQFQMTAYTQTASDLVVATGSEAKAGQVVGNFNTLMMLRVKELSTAKLVTEQLNEVEIPTITPSSGATDSNDPRDFAEFGSKNEDRITSQRVPMLEPADLMALPKGQAFALFDGGNLHKLRFPLLAKETDIRIPKHFADAASDMRARYDEYIAKVEEITEEGTGSGY